MQPAANATMLDDDSHAALDGGIIVRSAFQPIFRNQSETLTPVAFEALARPYRDGAALLPGTYLDAIAPDRLADVETRIRHVHLANAKHLPRAARRLFLNFHPSGQPANNDHAGALDALAADVRKAGLSPGDIICEITEQETEDTARMKAFVYALRARGYLVAVDDFGTAFADPRRVAEIAPDLVKIDGRIVREHLGSAQGVVLLRSITQTFAKDGIACVFEGLESFDDVARAQDAGARYLQGFALAAPQLAPGDFSAWDQRPGDDPSLVKWFR